MNKSEIFATIESANAIVDNMVGLDINSKEYSDLRDKLYFTLRPLVGVSGMTLKTSKNTNHFWVEFA